MEVRDLTSKAKEWEHISKGQQDDEEMMELRSICMDTALTANMTQTLTKDLRCQFASRSIGQQTVWPRSQRRSLRVKCGR